MLPSQRSPIDLQLQQFCLRWWNKAAAYNDSLADQFDKFVTLYVLFNRLYMHVYFCRERRQESFDDKTAATDYVLQFVGSSHFTSSVFNDNESVRDLEDICSLIETERFHIVLDWGESRRNRDVELLTGLRSTAANDKGKALLSLFYHIRCNLFHGHKSYESDQLLLLRPTTRLLSKSVAFVYQKVLGEPISQEVR